MTAAELTLQLAPLCAELAAHKADWLRGESEQLRTTPIYGRHGSLLSGELVAGLTIQMAADPTMRPWLELLTRIQIDGGCAPVSDRFQDVLDSEIIRSLDDKWFFCDTAARIMAQCNRKQRKVLDQSRRRVLVRLEAVLAEDVQTAHTLMVDRGFTGYSTMCETLSGLDYKGLLEDADGLVEDSDSVYRTQLALGLREAGVFPEDARYHDMLYLFGGKFGPASGLPEIEPAVMATLAGMGLPITDVPGLQVSLSDATTMQSGIHVLHGRLPDQVWLVGQLQDDWLCWRELMGSAGLARALTTPTADPNSAGNLWPEPILLEATKTVFASLPGNPLWLAEHAPRVDVEAEAKRQHLWWLYRVRYQIGSLRFARFLHGPGELTDKADPYEHYMEQTVAMRFERDNYLHDTARYFDQARTLLGIALGCQLLGKLEQRFGDAWFKDDAAGAWLTSVWAGGWDTVAAQADLAEINDPNDLWPMIERLEAVLGPFEPEE